MGIGPISGFGGLYGNYRMNSIPVVDEETVRAQDAAKLANNNTDKADSNAASAAVSATAQEETPKASRIANLEDISLTFNKEDSFDYIGSDAGLGSLDMEKAISDMKKDSILEEYQYFVGNQGNRIADTMDGSVMLK